MKRTPNVVTKVPKNGKIGCLKNVDLIAEHDAISQKRGSVLFGRVGRSFAKEKISLLRDAIQECQKPMLYLIRKSESDYDFYQTEIIDIWGQGHRPDIAHCPAYYRELYETISLWIEIRCFERIEKDGLMSLRLASTGRPILELLGSQASLMLAESIK
jgi:hypothetical protein